MAKGEKQQVLCINDGKIYKSITDAAKQYNMSPTTISRQLNGSRRSAKGYYFRCINSSPSKRDIKQIQKDCIKNILDRGTKT